MRGTDWKAYEVEHNIRPPLRAAVTITTDDREVVVYVGVGAFSPAVPEDDGKLVTYANRIVAAINERSGGTS